MRPITVNTHNIDLLCNTITSVAQTWTDTPLVFQDANENNEYFYSTTFDTPTLITLFENIPPQANHMAYMSFNKDLNIVLQQRTSPTTPMKDALRIGKSILQSCLVAIAQLVGISGNTIDLLMLTTIQNLETAYSTGSILISSSSRLRGTQNWDGVDVGGTGPDQTFASQPLQPYDPDVARSRNFFLDLGLDGDELIAQYCNSFSFSSIESARLGGDVRNSEQFFNFRNQYQIQDSFRDGPLPTLIEIQKLRYSTTNMANLPPWDPSTLWNDATMSVAAAPINSMSKTIGGLLQFGVAFAGFSNNGSLKTFNIVGTKVDMSETETFKALGFAACVRMLQGSLQLTSTQRCSYIRMIDDLMDSLPFPRAASGYRMEIGARKSVIGPRDIPIFGFDALVGVIQRTNPLVLFHFLSGHQMMDELRWFWNIIKIFIMLKFGDWWYDRDGGIMHYVLGVPDGLPNDARLSKQRQASIGFWDGVLVVMYASMIGFTPYA